MAVLFALILYARNIPRPRPATEPRVAYVESLEAADLSLSRSDCSRLETCKRRRHWYVICQGDRSLVLVMLLGESTQVVTKGLAEHGQRVGHIDVFEKRYRQLLSLMILKRRGFGT